jgi:dTDP-4-amino-4,6-dideoxygalactose transaminase
MAFKIPLFDLSYDEQEEKAVVETLKSRWISTGPRCQELESLFCDKLEVKNALTLSSCTAALHLAMMVLDIKEGDEVIVPSLTFAATANVVKYVGATPVFADIKSYTDLTIAPTDIERKITSKTKAIIPMHYGGFPADMDAIMAIAKKHNLKVVEDASHSPLSEYSPRGINDLRQSDNKENSDIQRGKGKKLGVIGDIGTFSFFSNKNISTGEGGMLVSNNEEYVKKARLLRSHGMTTMSYERAKGHATTYDIENLGYNYRMDDIRASIGVVQLKKLQADLEKRIEVRKWYIEGLKDISKIIIPFSDNKEFVSNYIFPIVLKDSNAEYRDEIRNKLHKKGIQTSVHYPAVHRFSIYKNEYTDLAITDYIVDNEITLPMFAALRKADVEYIVETIKLLING